MPRKWSNQYHRSRNAYPHSRGDLLDNNQKAHLCMLAKEAYDRQLPALILACGRGHVIKFDQWRHDEQFKVVGKGSLRECTDADYLPLKRHFENLVADRAGRALSTAIGEDMDDRNLAMFKLTRECEARGLELSYPAAICRSKFKCTLEQATPRQLWILFFDVKTSKHPRKRKTKTGNQKAEPAARSFSRGVVITKGEQPF